MIREYETGQHVIYVDPHGIRRDALVTIWWAQGKTRDEWLATQRVNQESWSKQNPPVEVPLMETCCNLLWVSGDEKRRDDFGRQIERASSVVHKGSQPAHGNYWCWLDE